MTAHDPDPTYRCSPTFLKVAKNKHAGDDLLPRMRKVRNRLGNKGVGKHTWRFWERDGLVAVQLKFERQKIEIVAVRLTALGEQRARKAGGV